MPDLAPQIQTAIKTALAADELDLPMLPEVALKIREETERPSVNVNTLAKVIGGEPGLVARLIKVVNGPMFRGARVIDDLPTAISRLGLEYAANLATGLAMKQMFQATSEHIDRILRQTWAHATEVAAISGVLASKRGNLRADQAMLAGLTHSIGTLPILSWAEENDHLLSDSIRLEQVIERIHGSIGTMILTRWEFPSEIALVPSHYQDYERYIERADFISVVSVANLLARNPQDARVDGLDLRPIPAFNVLRLDPENDDAIAAILEEASQSVS